MVMFSEGSADESLYEACEGPASLQRVNPKRMLVSISPDTKFNCWLHVDFIL